MLKWCKNCVIPSEENNHRPTILRRRSTALSLLFILFLQLLFVGNLVVLKTTDFLAAVFPSVLVELANGSRSDGNLALLSENPLLSKAAQAKADDMAAKGYFAHVSPDGVSPWFWFSSVGYAFQAAGENLAVDFYDSADVHRAWMSSPGHRANILKSNFTEIGIGIAEGMYQGRKATFIVELFGRPLSSDAPLTATTPADATMAPPENGASEEAETHESAPLATETNVLSETEEMPTTVEPPLPSADTFIVERSDTFIEIALTAEAIASAAEAKAAEAKTEVPDKTGEAEMNDSAAEEASEVRASPLARAASMPGTIAFYVLSFFAALALLALALNVAVKWRIQHKDLIVNGLVLIMAIITLLAVNYSLLFLSGAIV